MHMDHKGYFFLKIDVHTDGILSMVCFSDVSELLPAHFCLCQCISSLDLNYVLEETATFLYSACSSV